MGKRASYKSEFKAKVALEALKEQKTLSELSSEFEVHSNQVSQWKKQLKDGAVDLFKMVSSHRKKDSSDALTNRLYQEIGQLKVELDWLKKKYKS